MISLVAIALLAAAPAAFFDRDLGLLAREVQEGRTEDAKLAKELLDFGNCVPLPEDPSASLEGLLLRAEQARRARLGTVQGTIWADLEDPHFFRRETEAFGKDAVLQWPVEDERWPGELTRIDPPISHCNGALKAGDERPLLEAALHLAKEPGLRARLLYSLLVQKIESGNDVAKELDPDQLPTELRFHAHLARALAGAEQLASLIPSAPADLADALRLRACATAWTAEDWRAAREITEGASLSSPALALCRLHALDQLNDQDALRATMSELRTLDGADEAESRLRELTLDLIARRFAASDVLPLAERLSAEPNAFIAEIAERAISHGKLDLAAQLATALHDRKDLRSSSLLTLQLAYLRGDPTFRKQTELAVATATQRSRKSDAEYRFLKAIADRVWPDAARNPEGWRWLVGRAIELSPMKELSGWESRRTPTSTVEVVVAVKPSFPALPPLSVRWPEVRSLLSLTAPGGRSWDWFAGEEVARAR